MKRKRELFDNFEIHTFLFTLFSLSILTYFSLKGLSNLTIFRKGFYQIVSAHTGCGFANMTSLDLKNSPPLMVLSVIFAMMIGGGVCSTTGAIKLMRVGIIFKTLIMEIKRWMMPFRAVFRDRFHHLQDLILSDKRVKEAYVFTAIFLLTYVLGAVIGMMFGYPPLLALFESVSATANVGLSVGITNPAMPNGLKVVYILQMWCGRLEFLSVFVSLGFIISLFKR